MGILVVLPVVFSMELLAILLASYIWREMKSFESANWLASTATSKNTIVQLIRYDGEPTYDVTCNYRFSVFNQEHVGTKPYFGHRVIRLTPSEVAVIQNLQQNEDCIVYHQRDNPSVNVGYLIFPDDLKLRFRILAVFIGITGLFVLSFTPRFVAELGGLISAFLE